MSHGTFRKPVSHGGHCWHFLVPWDNGTLSKCPTWWDFVVIMTMSSPMGPTKFDWLIVDILSALDVPWYLVKDFLRLFSVNAFQRGTQTNFVTTCFERLTRTKMAILISRNFYSPLMLRRAVGRRKSSIGLSGELHFCCSLTLPVADYALTWKSYSPVLA